MNAKSALVGTVMLGLSAGLVGGCVQTAQATQTVTQLAAQIPPLAPGLARVWVLRQWDPVNFIGEPMVFVNGAPLAPVSPGTAYYRDLPPGTYAFTVASCGMDVNQGQTLALAPGTQTDMEVQTLRSNADADCAPAATYYVRQIPPAWADMYFNQLAYLGPR
jgi:hypothetical protein